MTPYPHFQIRIAAVLSFFGIDETRDYETVGVYDAHDLQKKVTEQCNQMEPPVRALFTLCEMNGKTIVSAEIPGIDISERPCFYKGVGRIKGSYVRVGDADESMSEYEIYSFDAFRKRIHDDLRTVPNAKTSLFDSDRLEDYKKAVKKERSNLASSVNEDEMLQLMGVMDELYQAIYAKNNESYWLEMERKFTQYCEDRGIRYVNAFYHSKLVAEKVGKS